MGGGGSSQIAATPQQQAQLQNSVNLMSNYETSQKPVQNYFLGRTENVAGNKALMTGQAASGARASVGAATPGVLGAQSNSGARAGSGRFMGTSTGLASAMGSGVGNAETNADAAVTKNYISGLGTIAAMGPKTAAMATGAGGVSAGLSANTNIANAENTDMTYNPTPGALAAGGSALASYGLSTNVAGSGTTFAQNPVGNLNALTGGGLNNNSLPGGNDNMFDNFGGQIVTATSE